MVKSESPAHVPNNDGDMEIKTRINLKTSISTVETMYEDTTENR